MKKRVISLVFISFILLMGFCVFSAQSQPGNFAVSGVVCDADTGDPLPGASVQVVGTNIGTSADDGGYYTLNNVPPTAVLEASCLGYVTMRKPVNNIHTIHFPLKEEYYMDKSVLSMD